MSEENKNLSTEEKVEEKKTKSAEKKPNFFARTGKKLVKFIKDTKGEMKKVVWMSKSEVWKSFRLVIATVVAVSIAIAIVDVASSFVINTIAGLIG